MYKLFRHKMLSAIIIKLKRFPFIINHASLLIFIMILIIIINYNNYVTVTTKMILINRHWFDIDIGHRFGTQILC